MHIPEFATEEERAQGYLRCIKENLLTIPIQEYMDHAFLNCAGTEVCSVDATGICTCSTNPSGRCRYERLSRDLQDCEDKQILT